MISMTAYGLDFPTDDYGNLIMCNMPYMEWVYSTCTYGSFGEGVENDFEQDI